MDCIICHNGEIANDNLRNPNSGLSKIAAYGKLFKKSGVLMYLETANKENVRIHASCQKRIANEIRKKARNEKNDEEPSVKMKRRSEEEPFLWNAHCLFCGKNATEEDQVKHPDRSSISCPVLADIKHLLKICDRPDKIDSNLSHIVRGRLMAANDLASVKCRYHRSCYRDFCREEAALDEAPPKRSGRPVNEVQHQNFINLCGWLEMEAELHTAAELHMKMTEIAGGKTEDVYINSQYLKQQLKKRYKENIYFAEMDGKSDIVCFKNVESVIINDVYKQKSTMQSACNMPVDYQTESKKIIEAAAKLIFNELRSKNYDCSVYPSNDIISSTDENLNWLTPGLRLFLQCLVSSPLQQASIGQAITHAVKPRSSIPPILFGSAVEMDHLFGSKWQLTESSSLGFSMTYKEVTRFKQSVLRNEDIRQYIKDSMQGCFGQWSGDNVDIKVCDLNGKKSLHAMGVVLSTTGEGNSTHRKSLVIPRQGVMKIEDVVANKGIPIITYSSEVTGLSKVVMANMSTLLSYHHLQDVSDDLWVDLLWHAAHFVPRLEENHPGWTGYMTDVSKGNYPGRSEITMLPIIDLDPTDMSCIYSTLNFVIEQAKELNIPTPVITFDQPLWVKANEIAHALGLQVVIILGGFHTLMSFAGSIGTIMAGSGLAAAMNTVYGVDVVKHIATGKAIARSLRANFMVENVLTHQLMTTFFPKKHENITDVNFDDSVGIGEEIEEEEEEGTEEDDYRHEENGLNNEREQGSTCRPSLEILSDRDVDLIDRSCSKIRDDYENCLKDLQTSEVLQKIERNMISLKSYLCQSSRTAKLWIQYLDYVNVIKMFIRAERTGNWSLHLTALSKMLNLFAAAGHYHYAKSARLHLQQMCELETKFPWVYNNFANHGYHTVRRSDRFWAGLWSDLIIEQVMMRSLKSRGGLTGGRGTTESVRMTWIHSMHRCASVHNAMATLTGNMHKSSEQHIELGENRIQQDISDMKKISKWFHGRNPFDDNVAILRSLSSGLCANDGDGINCDNAENVGSIILEKMDGVAFSQVAISRKDHAQTLDSLQPSIVIDKKIVHIDPIILFTRASTLVERLDAEAQSRCFTHEFTPEPTALFKDGLMRTPKKEDLRNRLIDYDLRVEKPSADICIVDGGAALHKAPWVINMSFSDLADRFISDIKSKFSSFGNIHIIFDGYDDNLSTKTDEHEGRGKIGKIASNVQISEDGITPVLSQKAEFLRNSNNKKELIRFLRSRLYNAGIHSSQAVGDADTVIVSTALAAAKDGNSTVVVSDDTDILVMLHYHHSASMADIFFQTSRKLPVIPKDGATKYQIKKATAKSKQKPIPMWWKVSNLESNDIPRHLLLFVHAWCGCDTTSAIYGKGKLKIISLLKDKHFKEAAEIFCRDDVTINEINEAGTQLMVKMYNGKGKDTPASLRQASWNQMINEKKKLTPENLCPTERATHFHSQRVYLQIQKWKLLDDHCRNPIDWGFFKNGSGMKPIKTDLEPAPENVLNIIRCNCKLTSRNTCGTNLCSCKSHGLPCVKACGDCRGMNCNNVSLAYLTNDDIEVYA